MHLCLLHSGPKLRAHLLDRDHFPNSVQYFFSWDNFMSFFYSSLFTLGIIVCICNMCKHNICLQVSSCAHYSMKQWSIGNARTFLTTLLLVNNSSCSGCCISCTRSLLILKITQLIWVSLCTLKEHNRKVEWGQKGIQSRVSHWNLSGKYFGSGPYLSQGINNVIKIIFYWLD